MRSSRRMPAASSLCRMSLATWCPAARCWSSWLRTTTRAECREQTTMDTGTRAALLARYKMGYQEVAATVQGLSDAELDARPPAGDGWTPRQIVHHLADSEMTSALRLRWLLAEEQPVLASYDEEAFARRLYYDRPIATSLDALRAARATSAEILDRLSEAEWGR